jgi:hypothetical protein
MTTVPAQPPSPAANSGASRRFGAFLVVVVLLFTSAIALSTAIAGLKWYTKKLPINVELKCPSIPTQTDNWEQIGPDHTMSEATIETLGTHNYVDRSFIERHPADPKAPRVVQVHLAYYTGSVDTVPHVPERCFVAGGASITDGPFVLPIPLHKDDWVVDAAASADHRAALGVKEATVYTARLGPNSRAPGNRVHLPLGIENLDIRISEYAHGSDEKTYAGYFFIANGALTSSAQNVRLLAFDLHSDYAFYLKVQFSATRIKGPEELAQIAGSILDEILPDVMLCVPDWTDVIRGDYPADNPRRKKNTPELSGR